MLSAETNTALWQSGGQFHGGILRFLSFPAKGGQMKKNQETKIAETDKGTEKKQVVRAYKDTVFRMLFREPEHLLELYNAVSGGHYTDPTQLQKECIEQGILKDFLRKNRSEVKSMSIFEYDEEKVKALWKQESFEEGLEQGRTEGRTEGKVEGITLAKTVFRLSSQKRSPEEIAEQLDISVEKVLEILE